MLGRKRHKKVRDSYIGSVFATMTQAAIATAQEQETHLQVWAKNRFLDLVLGTVTQAESELSNVAAMTEIWELVSHIGQADKKREAWRLYAGLEVEEELVVHLVDSFDRLASSRQEDAQALYFAEVVPSFGYNPEEDVPLMFHLMAMHASLTLVTVFQDTLTVPEGEQAERRFWAAYFEGTMVATWRSMERVCVEHGKSLGYVPRI